MEVIFYNFSKKQNSTKRPTGGTSYECVLKDACSVINPTIRLDKKQPAYYTEFNYAYIPSFNRYYFVNDIRNAGLIWEYDLTEDVLATYKTEIGNSSLYVLRASAEHDEGIKDTLYPVTAAIQTQKDTTPSPFTHDGTDVVKKTNGCFILGVVNGEPVNALTRYGSIVYYVVSNSGMTSIIEALLSDAILSDFSDADGTIALQKSIVDPAQFIKSCIWVPELYESENFGTVEQNEVVIWDWKINANAKIIARESPWITYSGNFTLRNHPQALTRGRYCNGAPFTQQILDIPPFGTFEIDTDRTAEATSLHYTIRMDLLTGDAVIEVTTDGSLLEKRTAKIGVPVQLSQVTRDYVGGATSVLSSIGSVLTGDIGGLGGGIASFVNSIKPVSTTLGQNGAMVNDTGAHSLYYVWHIIADDDNEDNGRPLCKFRQLSQIPGFIQVEKGVIDMTGTDAEKRELSELLENGFYYE